MSRSSRAGLQFPVARIHQLMCNGNYADRIGAGAPVLLAAVLEYVSAEIFALAGKVARDEKKIRITPRHLQLAISNYAELNKLLDGVTIAQGDLLLPKRSGHGPAATRSSGKKAFIEMLNLYKCNHQTSPLPPQLPPPTSNHPGHIVRWSG
uniref:Histone H2A n=1 Tax=Eptatretus burgeri TaxID=7764 RepID=A0A8C4RBC3_EPTBU